MRGLVARIGLRGRLAGWVALVVLLCTGSASPPSIAARAPSCAVQIDTELGGDAGELARSLTLARPRSPQAAYRASNRYVRSQPFAATSTLLFTITPGARTSTNRPELFTAETPDNGETPAQQVKENRLSGRLISAPSGIRTQTLPDVGDLRLLKRVIRLPGGLVVTVGTGEPLATVSHAQEGVARAFILAGVLALAAALLGAYLIGTRVSRTAAAHGAPSPRASMRATCIRACTTREAASDEVRVLTDAFNHMLDRLTDAFAAQREFVADASHELRTPLTVVAGQLEVLAAQPNPPAEEVRRVERLVQSEIARIGRLVDDLLLLAKTEQTQFLQIEPIALQVFVGELWDGMTLLAKRHFELGPVPAGTLLADPDRLAQALRNLVANAIAHTAPGDGIVRMRVAARAGGTLRFFTEDDGPGIPADQRERVFDRFHRTDAARDRASGGTGLGLAIVRAIAEAHGGRVDAEESAEGGARMVLELPHFSAEPSGPSQSQGARPAPARVASSVGTGPAQGPSDT